MGNCFSKFCCIQSNNYKPLIEIAKIHNEPKEVTMLYVPIISDEEAYI